MKKLNRSSKSGKIVTKEFAEHHPSTTFEETISSVPSTWTVPTPISPLSLDFGREDLNTLVSKVNEIINHMNL